MIKPGETVTEWEKSVVDGNEWEFWRKHGPNVIEFLRDAQRALDEGDWA